MGFTLNPLVELAQAKSAIIIQQVELLEVVTGWETPNRYHVYIQTFSGQFIYLFKCREESGWCMRVCCSGESRAFFMRIMHVPHQGAFSMGDNIGNTFCVLNRPFKCTCCCFARYIIIFIIDLRCLD